MKISCFIPSPAPFPFRDAMDDMSKVADAKEPSEMLSSCWATKSIFAVSFGHPETSKNRVYYGYITQ